MTEDSRGDNVFELRKKKSEEVAAPAPPSPRGHPEASAARLADLGGGAVVVLRTQLGYALLRRSDGVLAAHANLGEAVVGILQYLESLQFPHDTLRIYVGPHFCAVPLAHFEQGLAEISRGAGRAPGSDPRFPEILDPAAGAAAWRRGWRPGGGLMTGLEDVKALRWAKSPGFWVRPRAAFNDDGPG